MSITPTEHNEAQPAPRRLRRLLWNLFRFFRTILAVVVLFAVVLGLFLNKVGLPEFFKKRVIAQARAKGLEVQFSRLRLLWYRGIVAEHFQLNSLNGLAGPQLFVDEAECPLNPSALINFEVKINSLRLTGGRLIWPLSVTNEPRRTFQVEDLNGHVSFQENGLWELRSLHGAYHGLAFELSGSLANAPLIRQWRFPRRPQQGPGSVETLLHQLETGWRRLTLEGRRELRLRFHGDAKDLSTLSANFSSTIPRLHSPWGAGRNVALFGQIIPAAHRNDTPSAKLKLVAEAPLTPWGQARSAHLDLELKPLSNDLPVNIASELQLQGPQTRWGEAEEAQLRARGTLWSTNLFHLFQTNLVWTERLQDLPFEASVSFTNLHSPEVTAERVSLTLDSRLPQLRLKGSGKLAEGAFLLGAQLNTSNRELSFGAYGSASLQHAARFLPPSTQRWLTNLTLPSPSQVQAQGRLVLPDWNRQPEWSREVLPTLSLAGRVDAAAGEYGGISFSSAQSSFFLTNFIWRLPHLKVTRPEGALQADYVGSALTKDFHWSVHSQIDVTVAKSFFSRQIQQEAFAPFQFTTSPTIDAEISGRGLDSDQVGVEARVAATNFAFRGEAVKDCQTHLRYTNQVITFMDSEIQRDNGEHGSAPGMTLDLQVQKLYFTNGLSTLDPYAAARAIGESAIEAIGPYRFDAPPMVRVNGALDLRKDREETDLHFDVSGNQFHWNQFRLEQLMGKVDWVGQTLGLTNILGSLHTGHVAGHAAINFAAAPDPDFSFKASLEGVDLRELAAPAPAKTNKLEGILNGELIVTDANAGDLKSWQGYGRLNLRDGLIWEIPMFGLFSPMLNAFVPGLGNSRANEAEATFVVTNGIFVSKDLEIHATMMRMQFQGAVGLNRRVDARVEAEVLRDVPAVGFVLSKVFWPMTKLFEYKVSGTLAEPKAEPLYVLPKLLLAPLHPIKTLKGLFLEDEKNSGTDAPKQPP